MASKRFGTIDSNKLIVKEETFEQIATPSTPAAGSKKLYLKADGNLYTLDSSATEVALGSSSINDVVAATGLPLVARSLISVPNTTIVGRASIPDLANDLNTIGPINRIPTEIIAEIQNEYGTSGRKVYGLVGDKDNLFRAVGSFTNVSGTTGNAIQTSTSSDFIEIVFYGTGLNLLINQLSSLDIRATVDAGSEGSNLYTAGSSVLTAKNYSPNTVLSVSSGLTAGIHTIKIRTANTATFMIHGFEV